jgi:dTDP-glucose 4,6-dehydratase
MKRVLVTGGAGFIAHHFIAEALKRTDWEIVSLDRLDFSGNLNRLQDALKDNPEKHRVKIVHHDLKAEISLWIAEKIGRIDMIFHLAAGTHVDRSIMYPMQFALDNVIGTVNILEFARTQQLEKFFYFSTDEVFGPAPVGVAYAEYDRYNATNPYAASKAGAEEMCVAYRNTYQVPVVVTHTMNVFGPRQHPEKFIPDTIAKVRDGDVVTIHSDPSCTQSGSRFYIHVLDVADALLFLTERSASLRGICPKFNIAGEREVSNLELAQMIAGVQKLPLRYKMVDFHSSRPGHDLRYALDGALMHSMGWVPRLSVQERIDEVVLWSLQHDEWLRTAQMEMAL